MLLVWPQAMQEDPPSGQLQFRKPILKPVYLIVRKETAI